jgi:hypothetical protein
MFEGSWRTMKSQQNIFSAEFDGKNEGKVRSFLFRSQRNYELFDPILQQKIDEMPLHKPDSYPNLINTINGRAVFFNG